MILFSNAKIIYYNKKKKQFKLFIGNMLIKNGRLKKLTKKTIKNVQNINLNNQTILPGFVNAHIHLGEAFIKLPKKMELLEYLSFANDFNKNLGNSKQEHWDQSACQTLNDSIKYGTCAINSIRGQHIAKSYNIKALCGYPIMKSEKLKCFYEKGIEGYKNYIIECKKNNIIPGVFFHSFYSNDKQSFDFAKKCNKITKTFFALHLFEDSKSEQKVIDAWGKDSLKILIENKLLNKNTILVHGNNFNDNQLKQIKQKKATIVTCPVSANTLKTKHLNIKNVINKKINWCIATDGLATGKTANLLNNAQILFKEKLSATEILKAITINPAKALKIKNEILGVGSFANFNVFDCCNGCTVEEIFKEILTSNKIPKQVFIHANKAH